MRPVVIRKIDLTTDENRCHIAVAAGDGDIEDLIEMDDKPIQLGSTLEMYRSDWSEIIGVYRFVQADVNWSRLAELNGGV